MHRFSIYQALFLAHQQIFFIFGNYWKDWGKRKFICSIYYINLIAKMFRLLHPTAYKGRFSIQAHYTECFERHSRLIVVLKRQKETISTMRSSLNKCTRPIAYCNQHFVGHITFHCKLNYYFIINHGKSFLILTQTIYFFFTLI